MTCEPGIYKRNLDQALSARGLFFPVDPSSEAFASVGGMIGTNASGSHSLKYGHTIDYLESIEAVLYDGTVAEFGPVELRSEEWERIRAAAAGASSSIRTKIYNELFDLISPSLDLIRSGMPRVSKNSAGYRIDALISRSGKTFNPSRIFCGSEGTLGIVVGATFRVTRKPKKRGLLISRYDSFKSMGDSISSITRHGPSAAELMDKHVIEAASALNPEVRSLNKGRLVALIVEFDGDDEVRVRERLASLQAELRRDDGADVDIVVEEDKVKETWEMREESLGFAYKVREGSRRTEAVIEDTVVPPEHLGEYLASLYEIYGRLGLDSMSWGHVSEGNVHTRPFLNYKSRGDIDKAVRLVDEVYSLVKKYGGSSTGEHGDGILRSPYLKVIYGPEMIDLFRSVKRIFDPEGIMNPGKKTDALSEEPFRCLRYGERYKRKKERVAREAGLIQESERLAVDESNALNWSGANSRVIQKITERSAALSFQDETESCFGCGRCRELSNTSRMCPVFDAKREEIGACRGRNDVLRWMNKLEGIGSEFAETAEFGRMIYENCIQCKMCVVECPANTNVSKLMAEVRARYARTRGLPKKGYKCFFDIDKYARIGCALAPISNLAMRNPAFRMVAEYATGIDRRKSFPSFRIKKFVDLFYGGREGSRSRRFLTAEEASRLGETTVAFFCDTYINYNEPELGMRIVRLLEERNRVHVVVPVQKSCGLPCILEGDPAGGRRIAEFNVGNLAPYAEKGIPIITFSPSAGMTLKSDYLDVYDNPDSRLVSESTRDIHEYLVELARDGLMRKENLSPVARKCLVHLHCHSIVQQVSGDVQQALRLVPMLDFEMLENGCCGNGGSYSFVKGNLDLSFGMGRALADDVKKATLPVYSTGESCKVQLQQNSGGVHVELTTELLAEAFSV